MAPVGRKPKPAFLKIVTGNPGRRPIPPEIVVDAASDNRLAPPRRLRKRPQELWDSYIRRCPWLTHLDRPLAAMWCELFARFERDPQMVAGMVSQLRAAASELGLNPSSRTRIGAELPKRPGPDDPAKKYFR